MVPSPIGNALLNIPPPKAAKQQFQQQHQQFHQHQQYQQHQTQQNQGSRFSIGQLVKVRHSTGSVVPLRARAEYDIQNTFITNIPNYHYVTIVDNIPENRDGAVVKLIGLGLSIEQRG